GAAGARDSSGTGRRHLRFDVELVPGAHAWLPGTHVDSLDSVRGQRGGARSARDRAPEARTSFRMKLAASFAACVVILGIVAAASPIPNRETDRDVYEATAARVVVPDCGDLQCFRVLVPWFLGRLPGPSVVKWKGYAVVCNAATLVAVFLWCLS